MELGNSIRYAGNPYLPSVVAEVCYLDRGVYALDAERRQTYHHRRTQGSQTDWYSHQRAFARAFGRLWARGMLVKVWEASRFTRCHHCG